MAPNFMSEPNQPLQVTGDARPNVPAFACQLYVRHNDDGTVTGRVANLSGIEITAGTERDVLVRASREFKRQVTQMLADDKEIPWIDPILPAQPDEKVRSIPLHA